MNDKQKPRGFQKAFDRAKKIVLDLKRTETLVNDAQKKLGTGNNKFEQMRKDLESLFRLVSAWTKGNYRRVPLQTILFAISAIMYFLNPFDVVHDYLPFAGYVDDATLLAFVVRSIKKDIDEFLVWEKHS